MILWVLTQISIVNGYRFAEVACFFETSAATFKLHDVRTPKTGNRTTPAVKIPKFVA
jgi:hypothetical protein